MLDIIGYIITVILGIAVFAGFLLLAGDAGRGIDNLFGNRE